MKRFSGSSRSPSLPPLTPGPSAMWLYALISSRVGLVHGGAALLRRHRQAPRHVPLKTRKNTSQNLRNNPRCSCVQLYRGVGMIFTLAPHTSSQASGEFPRRCCHWIHPPWAPSTLGATWGGTAEYPGRPGCPGGQEDTASAVVGVPELYLHQHRPCKVWNRDRHVHVRIKYCHTHILTHSNTHGDAHNYRRTSASVITIMTLMTLIIVSSQCEMCGGHPAEAVVDQVHT